MSHTPIYYYEYTTKYTSKGKEEMGRKGPKGKERVRGGEVERGGK